ncbi:MAG: MFS transporter [Porphyromonas sp.]|nr:MFS transporter [Porphyromonas sp.]
MERRKQNHVAKRALFFILLMSLTSLLSDLTHEGATSINGKFLSLLGVSAATIGLVTGLGEFIGYGMRLLFGRITDKTRQYWLFIFVGYFVDLFAVPALALVHEDGWIWACALIIIERFGKAIKKPSKNTLVSFSVTQIGTGKGFAILEVIDQLGAFLGPLVLFFTMSARTDLSSFDMFRSAYSILLIPAVLTMVVLYIAWRKFPHPEDFEVEKEEEPQAFKWNKGFVYYILAISFVAFGFIDFPIVTLHTANLGAVPDTFLPLLYSGAMLVDGVAAFLFGLYFDRKPKQALILASAVSALFPIFIFGLHSNVALYIGIFCWGAGLGAQESILKAVVAELIPKNSRATGYGFFEFFFGISWFLGSWLLGALYDYSIPLMIAISTATQVVPVVLYSLSYKYSKE